MVTTEPVAIVGIFEAGHYLVYSLAEHFRLAVSMRSMMRLDDFLYSRTSVNPPTNLQK